MAEHARGHNIHDKRIEIPYRDLYPHYSDERFWEQRIGTLTVFLAKDAEVVIDGFDYETVDGAWYDYSDRIHQSIGHDEFVVARDQAEGKAGTQKSAAYFEELLRIIKEDESLELVHILSGVQVSGNGQPYQVFGTLSESNR